MIIEELARVLIGVVVAIFGESITIPPVPDWIGGGTSAIGGIMARAGQLSNWVPMEIFLPVVLAVLACLASGLGIKVARIVASFLTVGGGSAG